VRTLELAVVSAALSAAMLSGALNHHEVVAPARNLQALAFTIEQLEAEFGCGSSLVGSPHPE
jgi:hypothetical protein